ncbi:hypothetical protein [Halotalea alkalilenta]|uniref:hypothetical protein n=1 Tax=Halotalea alkalilenta TaxID=376489 RepID=UPI00123798D6|nr:hypothetical protein [Halotalea alkalilenta]
MVRMVAAVFSNKKATSGPSGSPAVGGDVVTFDVNGNKYQPEGIFLADIVDFVRLLRGSERGLCRGEKRPEPDGWDDLTVVGLLLW